jgi:hypothetical protein
LARYGQCLRVQRRRWSTVDTSRELYGARRQGANHGAIAIKTHQCLRQATGCVFGNTGCVAVGTNAYDTA